MVVFTNMFTKQIFCAPVRMKGTTAEKVVELFILHVFRTQGLPKVLLSDHDAKFTSAFWGLLYELLGTGLKFSASYHHQTNGQTELVNKTMEEALRIFVQESIQWSWRYPRKPGSASSIQSSISTGYGPTIDGHLTSVLLKKTTSPRL